MKENNINIKKAIAFTGLLILLLVVGSSAAMATPDGVGIDSDHNFYKGTDGSTQAYTNDYIQFYSAGSSDDLSAMTWNWDFGDGATSIDENPIHKYSKAGVYTVKLTEKDGSGEKAVQETATIVDVSFSASPASGNKPLKVSFTDTTPGTTKNWRWDFGDGTSSTVKNPVHVYTQTGIYPVTLTLFSKEYKNGQATGSVNVTELPIAEFSADKTKGNAPLKVTFTAGRKGTPTSWKWDFGDGATSTEENPIHEYSIAGVYTVKLTVSNAAGTDTAEEADYIVVGPGADFSADPISGNAPLKVKFTDKSTGNPNVWNWDFGDGTKATKTQNPVHTYSNPGIYNVRLTITCPDGSSSYKDAKITVTQLPVADFNMDPASGNGYAPFNVRFTDKSAGSPTSWNWNFGDGYTSTKQNPTHVYSKAGTYTVTLIAINANGQTSKTATVTVLPPNTPDADFVSSVTSGAAPLSVQFTDKSNGEPTDWNWDFGDGATSTEQSPAHVYSNAGVYTVTLKISNAFGSDTVEDSITVTAAPKLVAGYSANVKSAPLTAVFTDTSTGNPTKWKWNFGDGVKATKQNPTHKYSKAGTYTVTLTVYNAAGATASKSAKVTVYAMPVAAFSAKPVSGKAPLVVTFTDGSLNTPTRWQWNFGDGKTSSQKNPIHKYSAAGSYTVTLIATNPVGSNTVTKSNYIVVSK